MGEARYGRATVSVTATGPYRNTMQPALISSWLRRRNVLKQEEGLRGSKGAENRWGRGQRAFRRERRKCLSLMRREQNGS
jgi:hypothetical protein